MPTGRGTALWVHTSLCALPWGAVGALQCGVYGLKALFPRLLWGLLLRASG